MPTLPPTQPTPLSPASSVEEFLATFDTYILVLVKKSLSTVRNPRYAATLSLDIDDLAQRVRINIWRVLQQQTHIENPKAYIRRIVYHETINMLRQRRHISLSFFNEEEELYQENILIKQSEGMGDPADEIEQREMIRSYHAQTAWALTKLAPRQQKAMLCSLKDRLDDFPAFVDACKASGVETRHIAWPFKPEDKQRLAANISGARKKICPYVKNAREGSNHSS